MRTFKLAMLYGMMTMIFNAILFTLYDKIVEGYVNSKHLALTSLLGLVSGFFAYCSVIVTGAHMWL